MTLTSEEALRVARFCWPDQAGARPGNVWERSKTGCMRQTQGGPEFDPRRLTGRDDLQLHGGFRVVGFGLADAERLLVERGLGEEYGAALSWELCNDRAGPTYVAAGCTFEGVARIRTAPTEVIARAVLRVVDEQLSKVKCNKCEKRGHAETACTAPVDIRGAGRFA